jgi:hypothetical protein
MPVQYNPQTIDFSALAGIGQSLGGALGQHNLGTALKGAVGPNGEYDYNKMISILAERKPELAAKMATSKYFAGGGEGGDDAYFGTPIPFQRPDGTWGVGLPSHGGGFKELLMPGGGKYHPPVNMPNTGTSYTPTTKAGGVPYGEQVPIDVSGEAAGKKEGEAQGAAAASIPDVLANAQASVETIDRAIAHPGREVATGKSGTFDPRNYIGGTDAASYRVGPMKQAGGQSFLASIQQMRGMGSLSNAEGEAATAAATSLATEQTDEDHLKSLYTLKAIQLRGAIRTYRKAGQEPPAALVEQSHAAELDMKNGRASQPSGAPASSGDGWTDLGNGVRIRQK